MIEKLKLILDQYGWNYPVIIKIKDDKIVEIMDEVHDDDIQMGVSITTMTAADALLRLAKQFDPNGLNYVRQLIDEYSVNVKLSNIMASLGISPANYYKFRTGDDTKLSEEKSIALFKRLLRRPLK